MQTIFIESLFDKSLHIYDSWLVSSPMITKCATSATGFLIGDSIAQIMDKKSDKKYDFYRSIIMTSFGALVHAPSCHYVFNLLEETFPGKKVETILTKILVDQLIFCPIISTAFLSYVSFLKGKSFQQVFDILVSNLPIAVLTSWKVWSLVHIINYSLVPLRFRLLYVNVIQIFYSIFLSTLGSSEVVE